MLSPVLEVYVVWHPGDRAAADIATQIADHFHGGVYAGLLAGSMEVYMRSAGWLSDDDAPRPIEWPVPGSIERGLSPAQFVALLPLVGPCLNRAVNAAGSPWRTWFDSAARQAADDAAHVAILPMRLGCTPAGRLAEIIGTRQYLAEPDPHGQVQEPDTELRCRDLAQALAQWLSPAADGRLRVFISHTKRQATPGECVASLVQAVRTVLGSGRIDAFYDAHELKPGADWDRALRDSAASSALLALRTDLYASREWCQREMLTAKVHGMPVVVVDALSSGESRGSFLMDHTPRIPARCDSNGEWGLDAIRRAINLLADAWLHRVLWLRLQAQARDRAGLDHWWWAPQAPEPSTLARWLSPPVADVAPSPAAIALAEAGEAVARASAEPRMPARQPGSELRILHPDPPLAADERSVLQHLVALAGYGQLDLATPRLLASRGA